MELSLLSFLPFQRMRRTKHTNQISSLTKKDLSWKFMQEFFTFRFCFWDVFINPFIVLWVFIIKSKKYEIFFLLLGKFNLQNLSFLFEAFRVHFYRIFFIKLFFEVARIQFQLQEFFPSNIFNGFYQRFFLMNRDFPQLIQTKRHKFQNQQEEWKIKILPILI